MLWAIIDIYDSRILQCYGLGSWYTCIECSVAADLSVFTWSNRLAFFVQSTIRIDKSESVIFHQNLFLNLGYLWEEQQCIVMTLYGGLIGTTPTNLPRSYNRERGGEGRWVCEREGS